VKKTFCYTAKVVTSKFYAFFTGNSHTIDEIETLIIENENYEEQLQSANSAPIRTTFIQRMKKWNAGIFVLKTIRSLEHSFP